MWKEDQAEMVQVAQESTECGRQILLAMEALLPGFWRFIWWLSGKDRLARTLDGGEQQAPMGRAVIGGVITSTLLTLVVVPVAYSYLDNLGKRALRWFKRGAEPDAHAQPAAAGRGKDLAALA